MSTIEQENFRPVGDLNPYQVRDFSIADKTLINPLNAACLVDGEWLRVQDDGKTCVRAAAIGVLGELATKISYPLWAEKGRTDIQAMSRRGLPLVYMNDWEFETRIFDAAVALGSGAAITFVGQMLKVATIAIGGVNRTGLVGHGGAADSSPVVARVSKLHTTNGGWLRILKSYRF